MNKLKALIFGIFCIFFQAIHADTLKNMVVFGDSLSDNGNLYEYLKHQLPTSPPYYDGRFSNGPIWVETLLKYYYVNPEPKRLLNFAFGGAGVNEADSDVLFTLKKEVDSYLLAHAKADPQSLFVIWIGSNNYLAVPDSDAEAELVANEVVTGIKKQIDRLIKSGARYFFIVDLPDLGKTPAAKLLDAETKLSYVTKLHNINLKNLISSYRKNYRKINFTYFEISKLFDQAIYHPEAFGFTNVIDTCFEANFNNMKHQSMLAIATKIMLQDTDPRCDGYFFFDPVHPTHRSHEILAEKAFNLLTENNINLGN
jgi:phospholipase/lecithinase/hemolysin